MFYFNSLVFVIARLCVINREYCSCLEITITVLLLPTWEQGLLGRAPSPGLIHPVALSWHLLLSYFPPPLSMKQLLCCSRFKPRLSFLFLHTSKIPYQSNCICWKSLFHASQLLNMDHSLYSTRGYGLDKKYSIF